MPVSIRLSMSIFRQRQAAEFCAPSSWVRGISRTKPGRFSYSKVSSIGKPSSICEKLLENPRDLQIRETLPLEEEYIPVRDQGFRRAGVTAYCHRCALCAIRVRTLDNHTAVTAAHIRPWSETQDDRPANGMALCRMCH